MSISALTAGPATVPRPTDVALACRALRAPQWLHFAVLPALPLYARVGVAPLEAVARLVPAVVIAGLCLAFAYGINAIADRHGDHDVAKNPLAGLAQAPRLTWAVVMACAGLALALAALGTRWLRPDCAAISLAAGAVYSVGPRLKSIPVIGTLTNIVIFAPLALLARVDVAGAPHFALLMCTFVLFQTQTQLIHEAGDLAEDEGSGTASSAVMFGADAAMATARALGYVAALGFLACFGFAPMPVIASLAAVLGSALAGRSRPEHAGRARHANRRLGLAAGVVLYALAVADAATSVSP